MSSDDRFGQTGLPRQVCNAYISIYNHIQDWNKQHVEGVRLLTEIINAKLESQGKKQQEQHFDFIYKVNSWSKELIGTISEMRRIVGEMNKSKEVLHHVCELNRTRIESCADEHQFLETQTAEGFYDAAVEVIGAYTKETNMKRSIAQQVTSENREKYLRLHHYAWKSNVHISSDVQCKFEVMLESCRIKK